MVRRLYAYAVPAQKGVDPPTPPPGGSLASTQPVEGVVAEATNQVRAGRWMNVRLRLNPDPQVRSSEVRDAVMGLAFGSSTDAKQAADTLALRLSLSMDQRSPGGCLLVVSVADSAKGRQVTMWTFPRDPALRFATGSDGGPTVEVLQDAFSRQSHLRKAAILEGPDTGKTSFLGARIVDLQTGGQGQAADYWLHDFLDAELSLAADVGSAALGRALRAAWDDPATTEADRDQYQDASTAVRASTQARWSMTSFANQFLTDSAKARFLQTKEAREHRTEQFHFQRDAFDRILNFRVLRLDNGLKVSAPFSRAEELLEFEQTDGGTRVTASGLVQEDKVSQRG